MTPVTAERIGGEVALIAARNIGYGEVGANNHGPFLAAIGAPQGAEWCAWFASYCYRRACERLQIPPIVRQTGSARRLGSRLGSALGGVRVSDPADARRGDLVVWARGLPWQGHVGVVELMTDGGLLHTIEGNVGAFPAKVRRLVHDVRKERLVGIYGLRD